MPGTSNQRINQKVIPPQQPVVKRPIISVNNSRGTQPPQEVLPITSAPRLPITLPTDFTCPFILTGCNLKTFLEEYSDECLPFNGRFVFDSRRDQLAMGSQFLFHDYVAKEVLPGMRKEDAVAAKIIFAGDQITLYGSSATFGTPRAEELENVTKYLSSLLREVGYEVSYKTGNGPSGESGFVITVNS